MTTTIIRSVRVLTPGQVLPSADVILVDRDIASVRDSGQAGPSGTRANVIDGRGMTLMPGLIDAHVHADAQSLRQAALFGVTTVVDMFGDPPRLSRLATLSEEAAAASYLSAGIGATAPGSHPTGLVARGLLSPFPVIDDPGQAGLFVRDRIAEGSAFLKVVLEDGGSTGVRMPRIQDAVVSELVRHAHSHHLRVVAHATSRDLARRAVELGVDGLAHIFADAPVDEAFASLARQAGVFVIPTLSAIAGMYERDSSDDLTKDPDLSRHLDAGSVRWIHARPPRRVQHLGDVGIAEHAVRVLHDAGIRILAGTDAPTVGCAPGATLHGELVRLVRSGLTPPEALAAATVASAHVFGLADRGQVAPGMRADLLLVKGRPDHDIRASRAVRQVWIAGRPVFGDDRGPGTHRTGSGERAQ